MKPASKSNPLPRLLALPVMLAWAVLACGTPVTDPPAYTCPTRIPRPTATRLARTPLPTPVPSPTPFTIVPPADFYLNDAIFVGQPGAPLRLRFRLTDVQTYSVPPLNGQARQLVTWQLEIRNLGSIPYETVPVALLVITQLDSQRGNWPTSASAMRAAGFTAEDYQPLLPGDTRLYRLAAYVPLGAVRQFTYLLDGSGDNPITWSNQINPYCSGDVAD